MTFDRQFPETWDSQWAAELTDGGGDEDGDATDTALEDARRAELVGLVDDHIDRLWQALPEQSKRRLGVIAVSTLTRVDDAEHARLLGALALIAEAEGTLDQEAEFCSTYLTVDWVCEAVAEWERTRAEPGERSQVTGHRSQVGEEPESRDQSLEPRAQSPSAMSPAQKKKAKRREQVRLAVGRHRDKLRAKESHRERKKRERREERMADAGSAPALAVDGEGMSLPDGSHVYRYMAACTSHGRVVAEIRDESGIPTRTAIHFLSNLPKRDEDGIPFLGVYGYGLGYDMTKWLEQVKNKPLYELFHSEDLTSKVTVKDIKLLLIGKCLELTDVTAPKNEKLTRVWDIIKGFQSTFVKALKAWKVGTKEEWAHLEKMKKQRGNFVDSDWNEVEAYCKDECRLLAFLVEVYVQAHVAAGIDLKGKYHGAGSTSDAFLMMMDALNKKCTRETNCPEFDAPIQMRSAFSRSFFGGRAEVSRIGIVKGPVWTADIASAYPHVLYTLPCVKHGRWKKVKGRGLKRALAAATIATVHFRMTLPPEYQGGDDIAPGRAHLHELDPPDRLDRVEQGRKKTKKRQQQEAALDRGEDLENEVTELDRTINERALMTGIAGANAATAAWGPLPYRTDKGSIVFPLQHPGGWAWLPEYETARRHFPDHVTADEAWVLRTNCKCERPYAAIGEFYMRRIEWDRESGDKEGTGKGKVLKLGYNGCYGKMAQVIGQNPKYACRVVAGHITGSTRARLFDAIMSASNPWAVVYAATDGLIATEELHPPNPPENETTSQTTKWLGVWEISDPIKEDIFIVQPGFWFSLAPEGKARTRGTPLDVIYAYRPQILEQWRKDPTRKPRGLPKQPTFHGVKSSIRPPTMTDSKYRRDKLYGRWTEEHRRVAYVVNPKRSALVREDESYRLLTWALGLDGRHPESHEYKKDLQFERQDIINDEQADYVEPMGHAIGTEGDEG